MKIKEITDEKIIFDNGNYIECHHDPDCCENNYADFKQIEDFAYNYDFDECLLFEEHECGFRFGDRRRMFFVPCYSEQNGYYSFHLDVYYYIKGSDAVAKMITDCEYKGYFDE